MKRLLLAVVVVAGLLVPAPAGARTLTCSDVHYLDVTARGVGCSTAMTVERYWDHHEILTRTVRIAGIRWTVRLNRDGQRILYHGQFLRLYTTTFTAGHRSVQILSLPYG